MLLLCAVATLNIEGTLDGALLWPSDLCAYDFISGEGGVGRLALLCFQQQRSLCSAQFSFVLCVANASMCDSEGEV
jgi:hypothetical protein